MNGPSIAMSILIGTSLLVLIVSLWIAMRSRNGAAVNHDTTVWVFFGMGVLLIALFGSAGVLIAIGGIAYISLLKATLLLTAFFAALGMAFGLMRGLQGGKAINTQKA